MTTTVPAYAAAGPDQPLTLTTIERRDVGPHDVRIEIRYAGICHSDIHTVHGDWGPVPYPLVVGHEIAGTVAEVGPEVTRFAVGDRVGVGCMVDSCRECDQCRAGREQYCRRGATMTYASTDRDGSVTHGGYSRSIVVTEHFVLHIPDALALDVAAPLLCAGVTTYSPLRHWGAGTGTRVAVVGMGGLGHLAVRIAHAMGAHVTVLSQTLGKREDGLRLGADDYRATADPATFDDLAGQFDLILSTVSAVLDVDAYLGLLDVDGTMVTVGAPPDALPVRPFSLIGGRRSLAGSSIGSIAETQEMLDFCAEHAIGAQIEVIPADRVNEAWGRVLRSDVRYRFVIDVATLV